MMNGAGTPRLSKSRKFVWRLRAPTHKVPDTHDAHAHARTVATQWMRPFPPLCVPLKPRQTVLPSP